MKPIQNQTQLFVLSLICSLFAASISTVASQNVDPKVKEICALAKDPPLCEKTGSTNTGAGEPVKPETVIATQLRYARTAGLTAANMAVDMQKKATDAESKKALETCCNEFVIAAGKVAGLFANNVQEIFLNVRDEMEGVNGVFRNCADPNFTQVVKDFREVVVNIQALAAGLHGPTNNEK